MLAVSFRHKDIVEELVDKGANLDLQNQVSVPSHWCAVNNYWHKQMSCWMLGLFACVQDPYIHLLPPPTRITTHTRRPIATSLCNLFRKTAHRL